MDYELISAEDYGKLPEDDEQCFVEFEAICRRNMTRMLEGEHHSTDYQVSLRTHYMAAVHSVARQCGIPNIPNPHVSEEREVWEFYSRFALAVQGEVARIRVLNRRSQGSLSVQLTDNTRTKVQHYIARLRETIDGSELPTARKQALRAKLDDLVAELEKRRINLGKAMVVLSTVLVGLGGLANATTIAADGPAAVTQIMKLIGADKESEEAALSRLAPPPKALPVPEDKPVARQVTPASPTRRDYPKNGDLDDDIPF